MIKRILNQKILHDGDPDLMLQSFDDVFTFDLITFEGYDRETKRISCGAQLNKNSGEPILLAYTRTPEVRTDDYIYSVEVQNKWPNSLGIFLNIISPVQDRYEQLLAQERIGMEQNSSLPPPPSSQNSNAPSTRPAKAGDFEGFPLGHRSASAYLATLTDIDTASAVMTGQITRASARPFCTVPSSSAPDIERCIDEQISDTPGQLIASANCQTQEILTSGSIPFRREQGGWRNTYSHEFVDDDAPPQSGIYVIQLQFETLCPKAAKGFK